MQKPVLKVVFMGTPDFSVLALEAIIESGHDVVAVYSQPPRAKGRGQSVQKSPVQIVAEAHGIPVFNPLSLKKDEEARAVFKAHGADVAVVAAYGLILPRAVLEAPRFGCINIHASLLPRWRGASPIQRSVWAGDSESGITIMQMEEGLDTGPMIVSDSVRMDDKTTATSLHDALSAMGARLIVPVLDRIAAEGGAEATAQDDSLSTYAPMLSKGDGKVDWNRTAQEISRQVRALNPWPGVWTMTPEGRRLKIVAVEPGPDVPGMTAGTLADKSGLVACGGATGIRIRKVQPENARVMDIDAAINGQYLAPGMVLA